MLTCRRAIAPFVLVALLLLPGCGLFLRVSPRETELPPSGVTLPAHRCANAFLVEATINGKGPFTLLIDTGAGITCVSPAVADQLASDKGHTFTHVVGATGKSTNVTSRLRIETLDVGAMRLREFDALIMDTEGFEVVMGGKLDGILGYPAFRDASLTLDYPRGEVRVSPAQLAVSNPRQMSDLRIRGSDVPQIDMRIGDRDLRVIIDSGSGGELALSPGSADLVYETKPVPAGSTLALGGRQVRLLGRAGVDAEVAGVTLQRPLIETDAAMNLLGVEVLKHFTLTIDSRSGVARFEAAEAGPIQFKPLVGVGMGTAPIDGVLRVVEVFEGSSAERAGLRVGDDLVAIDGQAVGDILCERSRMFEHAGTAMLTIRRDGEQMVVPVEAVVMVP
jgi:hypothetical protein